MLTGVKANPHFFKDALNLRAHRQQILASNIANADTPNYKAVDVDFAKVLQGAQASRGPLAVSTTSSSHLHGISGGPLDARLLYRTPSQPSIDGNTVDSNVEMSQFTENAIHYQAVIGFLVGEAQTLKMAIQGQ